MGGIWAQIGLWRGEGGPKKSEIMVCGPPELTQLYLTKILFLSIELLLLSFLEYHKSSTDIELKEHTQNNFKVSAVKPWQMYSYVLEDFDCSVLNSHCQRWVCTCVLASTNSLVMSFMFDPKCFCV